MKLEEFKEPNVAKKIREEADKAIEQTSDKWSGLGFHIALGILGFALVTSLGFVIYWQMNGKNDVPYYFEDIGTTCLGAIAGLVVSPTLQS